ncbi:MAG: hypothetical protein HYW33_00835 [Candidatus Blackburnbacteria bacterium]|nr:hypothetical protein [Candidatus Blackburnbacteria bacterium]
MDEQTQQMLVQLTSALRELTEAVRENAAVVKHASGELERNGREIETLRIRVSQQMEVSDQVVRAMRLLTDAVGQSADATRRSSYR